MNFDDVLAQEEYLFMEGADSGQTIPLDSMVRRCCGCVYWEGIEELGSYIEGTCFAMMRVTGYAETCDEFLQNDTNDTEEKRGENNGKK